MKVPKRYIHDKTVLVLLSALVFVVVLTVLSVVVRVSTGGSSDYFVEYRSTVGISAFRAGGLADMLTFIWFSLIVAIVTVVMSMRLYTIKHQLSHLTLIFGVFLVTLALVVSHALLALR